MFVETKREGEVQVDPLTVPAFIAWLERQPADRAYDWADVSGCLLCFYLRETTGVAQPAVHNWHAYPVNAHSR